MLNAVDKLSDEARKDYWASLAFRYCEGVTPRLLCKILRHYGSAFVAYEALTQKQNILSTDIVAQKISNEIKYQLKNNTWREKALLEWQEAKKTDCDILLWSDYRYPLALKNIADAPCFFYLKGNIALLSNPTLAIVGSRKYTQQGIIKAENIANELSLLGITIVSGMALGIDYAAHKGALQGTGKTIAILGSGINVVYPKQHNFLYQEIAEQGLIISEFSPFTQPVSYNFPIRNRLVTGISEGVLIVEAALKSGSLVTARHAIEQNKNVYVLPPESSYHSLGGQKLLEEGAILVTDSYGIIAEMLPDLTREYEILAQKTEDSSQDIKQDIQYKIEQEKQEKNNVLVNTQLLPIETEQAKKNYTAYAALQRPQVDDDLTPMAVDFGKMAESILSKENTLTLFLPKKEKSKKNHSLKMQNVQVQKIEENELSEYSKPLAVTMDIDNPIIKIVAEKQSCTADEILCALIENGIEMEMVELSSELLMLEVDGYIKKQAGGFYSL